MSTLKNAIRTWVATHGPRDKQGMQEAREYLDSVVEVCEDLAEYYEAQDAQVPVAPPPHMPPPDWVDKDGRYAQPPVPATPSESGLTWDQALISYANCLRISAAAVAQPEDARGYPQVVGFPDDFSAAWLDPRRMTTAQAEYFGYPDPGLAATIQAQPYVTDVSPGTPAQALTAPAPPPKPPKPALSPEAQAARQAQLAKMVAQDSGRTSASRKFANNEAARMLSQRHEGDE